MRRVCLAMLLFTAVVFSMLVVLMFGGELLSHLRAGVSGCGGRCCECLYIIWSKFFESSLGSGSKLGDYPLFFPALFSSCKRVAVTTTSDLAVVVLVDVMPFI